MPAPSRATDWRATRTFVLLAGLFALARAQVGSGTAQAPDAIRKVAGCIVQERAH